MYKKILLPAWLVLLLAGCSGGGNCLLHIELPDDDARALVSRLEVMVVSADRGSCQQFIAGELEPAAADVLAQASIPYPSGTGSGGIDDVPVGPALFLVTGVGAAGEVYLRGCQEGQVTSGGSITVTVLMQWVCRPAAEACGDDIDNDCDGQTDEDCPTCQQDSDCDDGNPCTIDFCTAGECHQANFPDHTPCSDGDACTLADECLQGRCRGQPRDCSALDAPCLVGQCDPGSGDCQPVARPDGTACDDGLFCTDPDACRDGLCTGPARDCDDGDDCTADSCDEGAADCQHTLVPNPGAEGPAGDPSCQNGVDDDCDGLTDDADPNCAGCTADADCDDQNPCTSDSCQGLACSNQPLPDGTACDDGLFCTSSDSCTAGVCSGAARDCSAGAAPCQEGICLEDQDTCQFRDKVDESPCDDGLYCTVGDRCLQGQCQGSSRDCDDGDECTSDSCDEAAAACHHELQPRPGSEGLEVADSCDNNRDDDCDGLTDGDDPDCVECSDDADCDDGNPCTSDSCQQGSCLNQAVAEGTPCDDGLYCTNPDTCQGGRCSGPGRDCTALVDACHGAICNEQEDSCQAVARPDGTPCDDSSYCTNPDSCQGGTCTGPARDCDDQDPCTADSCDEVAASCQHVLLPNPGAEGPPGHGSCSGGLDEDCDGLTDLDDPDCYDCQQDGECDDGNPCTTDSCDLGVCTHQPRPDGSNCDDGLWCTVGDSCQSGACGGTPRDCSSLADACHDASCDEGEDSCQQTVRPDGTICDDGLFCTVDDSCQGGVCSGVARDCSALADACHDGVCNDDADACQAVNKPDDTSCDDGVFCTDPDTCQGGLCSGPARDCDDGDDCTIDTCSEAQQLCQHQLNPQGSEGEPGQAVCLDGADNDCDGLTDLDDPDCSNCGNDSDCDDGNPCTADSCSLGLCHNDDVADGTPCSDGAWCTVNDSCSSGLCIGQARDCSAAADACHDGVCDEDADACQSQQRPDGSPCDDGLWCTVSEQCQDGLCQGVERDCSDVDACTEDSCHEASSSCQNVFTPRPEVLDHCGDGIDQDCDLVIDGCCLADGSYPAAGSSACGPDPWYMTTADVNLDGRLDLATVNRGDNSVSVLLANGDGSFTGSSSATGSNPYGLAIGDLDADGWPDLVTANNSGNSLSVHWNQGGGSFGNRQDLSLAPRTANPVQVVIGDFNADAIADLACANWSDDSVAVLLGQGSDGHSDHTFAAPVFYSVGATGVNPRALVTADFNADGILDLAVANWNGGKVSILPGQGSGGRGDGSFGAATRFDAGSSQVNISAADFNEDAILDLAVVAMNDNAVNILLGTGNDGRGDGGFAARTAYPTGSVPVSAWPLDLDHDGILDLTVAEYGTGGVGVLYGNGSSGSGDGTFSTRHFFATASQPTAAVALEADGDSIPDLASCNYGPDNVVLLHGGGSGGVPDGGLVLSTSLAACDPVRHILAVDLDGDELADLVASCGANPNLEVFAGQGTDGRPDASFLSSWSSNTGQDLVAAAVGDIDSDGIPDLVVADAAGGSLLTFIQNGTAGKGDGTFAPGTTLPVAGTPRAVALIDVNRDAIADLLWTEDPGGLGVRLGTGTDGVADGGFSAASVYPAGTGPGALAVGDIDHDGIPDALVANPGTATVTIMLGQGGNGRGNGTFLASGSVAVAAYPAALLLEDLDGDGDLDLAAACRDANSISVRPGAGDGTFLSGADYACGNGPVAVAAARLDADSRLDLLSANSGAGTVSVLAGTGGGSFGPAQDFTVGGIPVGLVPAHFDWDGRLDLAVADQDGTVYILRGTGSCSEP